MNLGFSGLWARVGGACQTETILVEEQGTRGCRSCGLRRAVRIRWSGRFGGRGGGMGKGLGGNVRSAFCWWWNTRRWAELRSWQCCAGLRWSAPVLRCAVRAGLLGG